MGCGRIARILGYGVGGVYGGDFGVRASGAVEDGARRMALLLLQI